MLRHWAGSCCPSVHTSKASLKLKLLLVQGLPAVSLHASLSCDGAEVALQSVPEGHLQPSVFASCSALSLSLTGGGHCSAMQVGCPQSSATMWLSCLRPL